MIKPKYTITAGSTFNSLSEFIEGIRTEACRHDIVLKISESYSRRDYVDQEDVHMIRYAFWSKEYNKTWKVNHFSEEVKIADSDCIEDLVSSQKEHLVKELIENRNKTKEFKTKTGTSIYIKRAVRDAGKIRNAA